MLALGSLRAFAAKQQCVRSLNISDLTGRSQIVGVDPKPK